MKFDVTVIGAGPGGYVAAIRCSQLGFKTAIVDKRDDPGGTCLHEGCIPTKTLLEMSSQYASAKKKFASIGIGVENLTLDYEKMLQRKTKVIAQNCKGIQALFKRNGVEAFSGTASFKNNQELSVLDSQGNGTVIQSDKFIIASGSEPLSLPFASIDGERVLSSTEILSLSEIPDTLTIIGAGVIGLEIGSIFLRLGTKVQVLEIADTVLPNFDKALCSELMRSLKKQGAKFMLGCQVKQVENLSDKVLVSAKDKKGKEVQIESDYCLSAVGRKACLEELGLDKAGVKLTEKGQIKVDGSLKTSVDNIYAIGDVIGGAMLAHKASEEAEFVAEYLKGKNRDLNYKAIPSVVYTSPETASVGYTEAELEAEGRPYRVGICQNRALGRAHTADQLDGFAKVILEEETGIILGVHLVAPHASEMIGEAVVAFEQKMTGKKLATLSHAHPTYLEAIKEACMMAVEGKGIHVV